MDSYPRLRSVAALRPGDRLMVGDDRGTTLRGRFAYRADLRLATVAEASPGLVRCLDEAGNAFDIPYADDPYGGIRITDHAVGHRVRWTVPLPNGAAEAVKAYAEAICLGGRETVLLHLGAVRGESFEAWLVQRAETTETDRWESEYDWTGEVEGNAALWSRPLLVAADGLPEGSAPGDLVVAPAFECRVEGEETLTDLFSAARVGRFADRAALAAFMPEPFASHTRSDGQPLGGERLVGPCGHEAVLDAYERAVARTQPDEALVLWLDRHCSVVSTTGLAFHRVDDIAGLFHGEELGDGLYVFENAKWWGHTSHEGEHDSGIDGDWRAAVPADAARFGFDGLPGLDAGMRGLSDATPDEEADGFAARLMGEAEAALAAERAAAPVPA